ncbi:hypothetical protein [Motiliproteus sp. MSK22-1]|uniref:hypothetical protein n=1 Tax=Motiliproteus sp. MSK22-1 TaxID=1897630 RepID=UPI0018E92878|nr:hypothetical protein [Motiliproteus sp. MSK22-1]
MYIYRLVSTIVIGTYLLSPIIVDSWADADKSWYRPFVFWFLLIATTAWLEYRRGQNEL